ncbi:VQ-like protein [Cynara cardunculus var. scolymus]|uniref:VQ-like protein n=1 Tax=Cynara cardunculus var. scolymus TaxID=59895 RepID=A0A103XUX8_CYNCS|nr:VQ-like protein [Cynara cardunculus var. scolymus]
MDEEMLAAVRPTKNSCSRKKSKLKVVYISSPMKVKTSASKFRALVQELTGRHSDISRYHGGYFHHAAAAAPTTTTTNTGAGTPVDGKPVESCATDHEQGVLSSGSEYDFLDDVFRSEIMVDDQFEGMFPSYSLYDSCLS